MQSGISASHELLEAFKSFVSTPTQRALLASISSEQLVPGTTIPLESSTFTSDLHLLQPHLKPDAATYVLLKTDPSASNGFVAITYVPNAAPVRQKMLFASTRLTLVRELGIERFQHTIFATEAKDLSAQGWAAHEAHEALAAPLTTEEAGLAGVKQAEAAESQGTAARRGHVSGRLDIPLGDGVLDALRSLQQHDCKGTLVQLKYALPDETLLLEASIDEVPPTNVATLISPSEPRYSFYSHPNAASPDPRILFIYTCPTASKIKERMVYSTSKSWTRLIAERDAGLVIAQSLEATAPDELEIADGPAFDSSAGDASGQSVAASENKPSTGFARPKRPGRR